MIERTAERRLSTRFGNWREILYRGEQREIIALILGEVSEGEKVACRIHSSCLSAHVLNSTECDCREQMEIAQRYIVNYGRGLVIVLDQEGKGNGHRALMLAAKMASDKSISQHEAYRLLGFEPPDCRDYTEAAEVLADLKVSSIELLTNNPDKECQLRKAGVSVVSTRPVALDLDLYPQLRQYYDEKAKLGHNVYLRPANLIS
jgi:GTP cyclohydrolase II